VWRWSGGGIGDKRRLRSLDDSSSSNSKSLFSTQPVLPTHREEPEPLEDDIPSPIGNLVRQSSRDWVNRRVDHLMGRSSSTGLGAPHPKSLVDLIQVRCFSHTFLVPNSPSLLLPLASLSRSSSRAANEESGDATPTLDMQLTHLQDVLLTSVTPAELNAIVAAGLGSHSLTPIPGVASIHGQSSGLAAPVPRTASLDFPVSSSTQSASPGLATIGSVSGRSGGTMNLTSAEARSVALNRAASGSTAEFVSAFHGSTASSGSVVDLTASLQGMSMSVLQEATAAMEDQELLQLQQEQEQHPPGVGMVMPYNNSPLTSPVLPGSPVGAGSLSTRRDDCSFHLSSGTSRSSAAAAGTSYSGWQSQRSPEKTVEIQGSTLLEEYKNSKTRHFELSDITGHVVEFSADQHGSHFIQQKLETASPDEKGMVFQEVLPHALTLMTDVFGNYVIQKFFEHGTSQQRHDLASQLIGHVLVLSLQMYGCRVIQKALEVVDVVQQTQLVSELDGHVMHCVRDQNGNHVIQKCIECVPPDRIQCIISAFYNQVVVLSTHPYGCRVIQRVLEHCRVELKQQGIMEEILHSTCILAQDQYGNYVVQHVLEHGRDHERKEIITKLAGQIVQMSQHKFASNVVEKCLEFGGPADRQILINEMLGHTDENEPLQVGCFYIIYEVGQK
ncbi:unnamed protein product, partial [Sphagnum jensenii]